MRTGAARLLHGRRPSAAAAAIDRAREIRLGERERSVDWGLFPRDEGRVSFPCENQVDWRGI
jgi:hypothetical protein